MSVDWVACNTCYTKTEGTDLGGIERTELAFPGVMPKIKKSLVGWPIKTEFVIENLNIYEMQKQTCERENQNNRKS